MPSVLEGPVKRKSLFFPGRPSAGDKLGAAQHANEPDVE
jgi:hypothetical protein